MSDNSKEMKTPQNVARRQLGPRRSVKRDRFTQADAFTPPLTVIKSDLKDNYRSLESPDDETPCCSKSVTKLSATPSTPCGTPLEKLAFTTNCRPYRLALSRRVREKLTKKRLEFHLANNGDREADTVKTEVINDKLSGSQEQDAMAVDVNKQDDKSVADSILPAEILAKISVMSKEELIEEIQRRRQQLEEHKAHARKVQEINEAIEKWSTGFRATFHDLHESIDPQMDKAELLKQLRIPEDMLPYLEDDLL